MERKIAEDLMAALITLGAECTKVSEITQKIQDNDERIKFRRGLGGIIGDVYTELMIPIIRQYPDLDPDKEVAPSLK